MLIEALVDWNELIIFISLLTKPKGSISTSCVWRIASDPTTWFYDRLFLFIHISYTHTCIYIFLIIISSVLSFPFETEQKPIESAGPGRQFFRFFFVSLFGHQAWKNFPDKFKFMYEILMNLCRLPSCYISNIWKLGSEWLICWIRYLVFGQMGFFFWLLFVGVLRVQDEGTHF